MSVNKTSSVYPNLNESSSSSTTIGIGQSDISLQPIDPAALKERVDKVFEATKKFPANLDEMERGVIKFLKQKEQEMGTPLAMTLSEAIRFCLLPESISLNGLAQIYVGQSKMGSSLKASISSCDELVKKALKELNLEKETHISNMFESILREELSKKLISEQSSILNKKFKDTGVVTVEEMNSVSSDIHIFNTKKDSFVRTYLLREKIVLQVFELNSIVGNVFEAMREQVRLEKATQLKSLSEQGALGRFVPSFLSYQKTPAQIEALFLTKLQTILALEDNWSK